MRKIGRVLEKYLPHTILFAAGVEYGIYLANNHKVKSLKQYMISRINDKENRLFLKQIYDAVFDLGRK